MNTDYPYKAFITPNINYILLDGDRHIRGTSYSIKGITKLQEEYGWGRIFEFCWDGERLTLGKEIRLKEKQSD